MVILFAMESRYHESSTDKNFRGRERIMGKKGPIYLAYGTYFVNVTVLDDTGKNTILHWLQFSKD